jgi:hypothetical protein
MKKLFLVCIIILCSCKSSNSRPESGHWGDRNKWNSKDFLQTYYADSDGQLIGWIKGTEDSMTISAHCSFSVSDNIGNYENDNDAQQAVESRCPFP